MSRTAKVERKTRETQIVVVLELDGSGETGVSTGIPFFDHMLEQVGRHACLNLEITASGDLAVDAHHTVEDVGIALGEALAEALGDKGGIRRYGLALIPMDEALAEAALDLSGRPYLAYSVDAGREPIGTFDPRLAEEFFRAFTAAAGLTLHMSVRAGKNPHHILEAAFKAVARALGDAVAPDPRIGGAVPSTKEML